MNNTTTYYITTDSEDYVTGIVSKDTAGAFPLNVNNLDVPDFTNPARMGLYKATKDGLYQQPYGHVLEQAQQIEQLQSLVNQQSQDLSKAQGIIDQQSTVNKQLLTQVGALTAKLAAQSNK